MHFALESSAGLPYPLGATIRDGGVNFAVVSRHAEAVELCLFDAEGTERRLELRGRSHGVWHGFVRGPGIGPGAIYGFRAHGPAAPQQGHRFDPGALLLDPYAREIVGRFDWDAPQHALRARVPAPLPGAPAPGVRVPASETVLYELHVKGFSKLLERVPAPLRGTYAGLGHPACIEHLRSLGVTTLSLLPVHHSMSEHHLAKLGLTNYWGYNTIGWFCPDPRLSSRPDDPTATRVEFRAMVDALHAAGFEVVLDVVYNHSAEAGERGPTLSLRGLDNALYYRLHDDDRSRCIDWTGCGNTLNFDHAEVVQLVLDSLRHWVEQMGVDGFRFDLAPILGRGSARGGGFDREHPLLVAIGQDPLLARTKLIAEPWDLGPDGYQLGRFPDRWLEWNDRFRDDLRRFWLHRGIGRGEFARRLAGSNDRFHHGLRGPSASINFVASHDGFTLADVVAHARKHNLANGEDNRDGNAHEVSSNCGVEGRSEDPSIVARRARLRRALIASLLVSQGTPMLLAGDELGNSQGGNNNAYCQDNPTAWLDWSSVDTQMLEFVRDCIALRRRHPALRRDAWLQDGVGVQWRRPDGSSMSVADWHDQARHGLAVSLGDPDDALLLLFNAELEPLEFTLPPGSWTLLLDSAAPRPAIIVEEASLQVSGESVFVLSRATSTMNTTPRSCGVLLHPTSLPGPHGIGDLGPSAYHFVNWLHDAGQGLWQVLPLNPIGPGNSPYASVSVFAGNPLLVALEPLIEAGWLAAPSTRELTSFDPRRVDFEKVIPWRMDKLRSAAAGFFAKADASEREAFAAFVQAEADWLEDYALFMALDAEQQAAAGEHVDWPRWPRELARREPAALEAARARHAEELRFWRFVQFCFDRQWQALRAYANERSVKLVGDMPIFVAGHGADCWSRPQLYVLDSNLEPQVVAGVPPDFFSKTGQRWGNPLYDWKAMAADGYAWWIARVRRQLALTDILRVDHFRGFVDYWEIPASSQTAIDGRWVPGPGAALFEALDRALGKLPLIAEDLGIITAEVEALRDRFALPGMKLLQFGFGEDASHPFLPHNWPVNCVAYTGTHDNDTIHGWYASASEHERAFARAYVGVSEGEGASLHWAMIRALSASAARMVVVPLQDVLGLDGKHRMNVPGEKLECWTWRFAWNMVGARVAEQLAKIAALYGRGPFDRLGIPR
jgi:glycogen debranching enzyme GlgX/4-alpha-glucanotransferase